MDALTASMGFLRPLNTMEAIRLKENIIQTKETTILDQL